MKNKYKQNQSKLHKNTFNKIDALNFARFLNSGKKPCLIKLEPELFSPIWLLPQWKMEI